MSEKPRMTLVQFLDRLESLTASGERSWYVNSGEITSKEDDLCPIHEVWLDSSEGYEEGQLIDVWSEADRLGLREKTAHRIANAADSRGEPALRKRILMACGLPEEGASNE